MILDCGTQRVAEPCTCKARVDLYASHVLVLWQHVSRYYYARTVTVCAGLTLGGHARAPSNKFIELTVAPPLIEPPGLHRCLAD